MATCLHLVGVGKAVALCQATFRLTSGLVMMPLAGAPLRWRHLLGWHADSIGARAAAPVVAAHARAAYADAVPQRRYADWLVTNPEYGAVP